MMASPIEKAYERFKDLERNPNLRLSGVALPMWEAIKAEMALRENEVSRRGIEWIPVTERVPEETETEEACRTVIVWCGDGDIECALAYWQFERWENVETADELPNVTHWAEINPPK